MGFTPKGSVHAVGFDSRSLRIKNAITGEIRNTKSGGGG